MTAMPCASLPSATTSPALIPIRIWKLATASGDRP
jgi:hypothetical protein